MTIASTNSRNDYTAGGASCQFAYTFKISDSASIAVYLCGTLQTTGYTVSGAGNDSGGTVTFSTVPASGSAVALIRDEDYTQTLDLEEHGAVSLETIEDTFDKGVMLIQQVKEITDRAILFDPGSCDSDVRIDHPTPGYTLAWNAAGDRIASVANVCTGSLTVPAFTGGSIVFAADATTLSQDNDDLYWDCTQRRLTVGTGTPLAAKITVVVDNASENGIIAINNLAGGASAANFISASTGSPSVSASSTCHYALQAFNVTDQGSDLANANAIGIVGQSVYANAGYFQQGAISGTGSTLARDNIYSALYVTRVTASLNGFQYTAPLFRIQDTTSANGMMLDVLRNGVQLLNLNNCGVLQTCEVRTMQVAQTCVPAVGLLPAQGVAKAWVVFDGTNTNPITPSMSYNIAGASCGAAAVVTKRGTGDYCVSFLRQFSCDRYVANITGGGSGPGTANVYARVTDEMRGGCIRFVLHNENGTLTDAAIVSATFYGLQ